MLDFRGDSSDIGTSGEIQDSSRSSMSSGSSFGRLSFELQGNPAPTPITPRRASDSATGDAALPDGRRGIGRGSGLSLRDFRLVRQIGAGDIGRVYLCRRSRRYDEPDGDKLFAMKVVDKEAVALKKKSHRAEMEKKILEMVDHPFLPRLHASFEYSHFSCVVMEFCPGGDLHSLRHRQPHKRFSLSSARFYAAEVLLAMEYLHLMGVIYRDLKPENVLVRSDGHIMLSDFDLSFYSGATIPSVQSPGSPDQTTPRNRPHRISAPFPCFPYRLFRSRKVRTSTGNRLFVAEPVDARSRSFVGTHEYVAPEVASGGAHGAAVDWWALGIFVYEMVYGRTPFAAGTDGSNGAILHNILKEPLAFPTAAPATEAEHHARSLVAGLLAKDPNARLGSRHGAAEVKAHPFFGGLNFALVRSLAPPVVPGSLAPSVVQGRRVDNATTPSGGGSRSAGSATPKFDYF